MGIIFHQLSPNLIYARVTLREQALTLHKSMLACLCYVFQRLVMLVEVGLG